MFAAHAALFTRRAAVVAGFDAFGPGTRVAALSGAQFPLATWTHTPVGVPDVVFVDMAVGRNANGQYSAYTRTASYGGKPMTSIGARNSGDDTTANAGFLETFAIVKPLLSGPQTVSVSVTSGTTSNVGSLIAESTSYVGFGSLSTPVLAGGTTGNPSVAAASAAGHMVHSAIVGGAALSLPTQTQRYLLNGDNGTSANNLMIQDAPGAATVTFGATFANDWWAAMAVDLIPG